MPKAQNLIGLRFGRLRVTGTSPKRPNNSNRRWVAVCDCGKIVTVFGMDLRSKKTASCGCLRRELLRDTARSLVHGHSSRKDSKQSPTYMSWASMISRCYNKKAPGFHNYGGRGISVCQRWRDDFVNFLADMGERPSTRHSIERVDVNGDYTRKNCRWATNKEQMRNTRVNRLVTYQGETKPLAEWAEMFGLLPCTLRVRLYRLEWSIGRALETPINKTKRNRFFKNRKQLG